MNDITIIIRYGGEKQSIPTQDNIILDDLLQQLGPEDAAEYLRITRRIIRIACQNQQQLHP